MLPVSFHGAAQLVHSLRMAWYSTTPDRPALPTWSLANCFFFYDSKINARSAYASRCDCKNQIDGFLALREGWKHILSSSAIFIILFIWMFSIHITSHSEFYIAPTTVTTSTHWKRRVNWFASAFTLLLCWITYNFARERAYIIHIGREILTDTLCVYNSYHITYYLHLILILILIHVVLAQIVTHS